MTSQDNQKRNELYITRFIETSPTALYDIGVGPKTEWKYLGEHYPEMDVYGVEANPDMCTRIIESGFRGVLLNKAVFDRPGFLELKVYRDDGLDASLLSIDKRRVSKRHNIECITLDEVDRLFGYKSGILLWMDIEGAELSALKSAPNLMSSKRVSWINLEVRENPPWADGCTASDIDTFLLGHGYKKIVEYNRHPHIGHYDVIYSL